MSAPFVHLHVHSEFSMLDGALRIPDLVERAAAMEMPAVALTDNVNMFGALALCRAAKSAGIEPILGAELNFVEGSRTDGKRRALHHLVVLAASQEGYENVVRLTSRGWVDGMIDDQPAVDAELLREHAKGVIALSGCMGGHVAQKILLSGPDAGREALRSLAALFEEGCFYVELQDHGFPESGPLNEILIDLADELGLPLVATNDCHYPTRDSAPAQLALNCIGQGRTLREAQLAHHNSSEMYFKSPEEMQKLFASRPDALANTLVIAERCGGAANPFSDPKLPRFAVPEGETEAGHLRELAARGLDERIVVAKRGGELDEAVYRERLEMELGVIESMGFPGYFLIVQDFIRWAKENEVPVGPGRGSGAGSIVAWALRITDLDPIFHGLLFERFLNPERVSMPDFDIDFCMDRRELVIDYVRSKYGAESVGQIATFHQLKSKSCVRDVGRVMGMAPAEAGRIAGMIPELGPGQSAPIRKAIDDTPRLKEIYETDPQVRELLDTVEQLENLTRHAGMHAAGVVISEGPIWDHVPVFCPEPGSYVTQYDKGDVEAAGLVKFDFLGLRTLTVIDICLRLIKKRPGLAEPFDLDAIPMDDAATYALLRSGETTNVFQLESSGMQGLFKKLKPDRFEDIVAAVALYRPGPMGAGMDNDFVERKHGRQAVTYLDPCLEKTLEPTRGVIVYQEQVMQIAREMAGYSLGGADLLRRAMGKKKASEMEKQRKIFVEGAVKLGHAEATAEHVFEQMAYFAGYGFNKSHSAAYALITYQTAYLKAHFPVEFTCATLSADKDKTEKVVRTVAEARSLGITVLPPDVNESQIDFTVVYAEPADASGRAPKSEPVSYRGELRDPLQPKIRFGLGGIKGVGEAALDAVLESRRNEEGSEQPFLDLFDFCARVDLRRVNKSVAEALVQSGAFDQLDEEQGVHRAQAFAAAPGAFERGKKMASDRASGQTNLFGLLGDESTTVTDLAAPITSYPDVPAWDSRDLLTREKTSLGFYVSGHPLDRYKSELRRFADATTSALAELDGRTEVRVGGSVEGYRERRTKAGADMAFFHLEDPDGRVEVIVRPRVLATEGVRDVLHAGEPVLVTAHVKHERDRGAQDDPDAAVETKLLLDSVVPLAAALAEQTERVALRLSLDEVDKQRLEELRRALTEHPGRCPVALTLVGDDFSVTLRETGLLVAPEESLKASVERLFGAGVCLYR
ncbi:MAG: DNA polymerase III subunit alpha [Deltaproteobacteria bacterium]|nr:DNA polymerase III subunit alpha [Deltaproteobacteria bacterium]